MTSRFDEIVALAVASFRHKTTAANMQSFMEKYKKWRELRTFFYDEIEALSTTAGRPTKLKAFLLLSDDLAAFIHSWKKTTGADLRGHCESVKNLLTGLDDDSSWKFAREEVQQAQEFLQAVCETENRKVILRMPHTLRSMMSDKEEAENIQQHIQLLGALRKLKMIPLKQEYCNNEALNNISAAAVRCFQEVLNGRIKKYQNSMDRENSFGLYMLSKLMREEFIINKEALGGETGEGTAVKTKLKSSPQGWASPTSPFFVTKSSNGNQQELNNLLHEFVIGSALNFLRERTPGFMFTYGGFFCSGFAYTVNDLCLLDDNDAALTTLTFSEFIDGQPLSRYAGSNQLEDLMKQVLWTLVIGGQFFEFSHNDLHRENILVRKLQTPKQITYKFRDGSMQQITTDLVPQIIDFGKARVKVKNSQIFYFRRKQPDSVYLLIEDRREDWMPSFDWIRLVMSLSVVNRNVLKYLLPAHRESRGLRPWISSLASGSVKTYGLGLDVADACELLLPKTHWW
jgi:hypothetical protein